jgi:hypothetical protein
MELINILDKVPIPVLAAFAGVGFLFAFSKLISAIRLLLSLFVLPGTNVRPLYPPLSDTELTSTSCELMDPKVPGQ